MLPQQPPFLPVSQVCLHYQWESILRLWGGKASSAEPLLPLSTMVWREQAEPWYYFFTQECNCTDTVAPGHVTTWSIQLLHYSLFYPEVMAEGRLWLRYNLCLGHCKRVLCSYSLCYMHSICSKPQFSYLLWPLHGLWPCNILSKKLFG